MTSFKSSTKLVFTLLALFSISMLVLAGCGSNEEAATNTETSASSEETDTSSSSSDASDASDSTEATETEAEETYTIEHAMGTTEIKGTPKKVVILTNHGTEALLSLGVKPVGAVQSWTGDPWYDHIADQMEGVEVVGLEHQVNVEAIAALQPDLIIGNKMRQEEIYEQLNAIAPTVFEETLRGDWQVNFGLIAKAVNKEEEGQKVLDQYKQRIADFKAKAGDQLEQEVSIIRFLPGDVRIYQKDSFSGVILEEIGFNRPASQDVDAFAEMGVSKERIPDMDGDILFYFTYDKGDGEGVAVEEDWINDPLFQNLSVVKAGNVHKVEDDVWNTAGGVIAANLLLDDLEKFFLNN
jgi:iron complex transport system substrate-binding protein